MWQAGGFWKPRLRAMDHDRARAAEGGGGGRRGQSGRAGRPSRGGCAPGIAPPCVPEPPGGRRWEGRRRASAPELTPRPCPAGAPIGLDFRRARVQMRRHAASGGERGGTAWQAPAAARARTSRFRPASRCLPVMRNRAGCGDVSPGGRRRRDRIRTFHGPPPCATARIQARRPPPRRPEPSATGRGEVPVPRPRRAQPNENGRPRGAARREARAACADYSAAGRARPPDMPGLAR